MNILKKLDKGLCTIEEVLMSVAMLAMCIVVFVAVVLRFMNVAWSISDELARYLMIWCIYIGVIAATREKAHVGVEVLVGFLPKKVQNVLKVITDFVTLATFVWLFYLTVSWILGCVKGNIQLTPMMKIPYWIMYSSVAIGFGLSIITQIQVMVKDHIIKPDEKENENEEVKE